MQDQSARARKNLKYLTLLAREYPNIAAASSEIINLQAILKLPKGTEHFMSDLHGEAEAFTHIVNNASGVIKEKVDRVLGPGVPDQERAEFATLIYYPAQKLDELKERQTDLNGWYRQTLYRLIDVCRVVSSKHTRSFVRKRLPKNYAYILDELLHAHFEDHDKEFYYDQILSSIIDVGRADDFIEAMCVLIKNLAVKQGDYVTTGTPLATISQNSHLILEADLSQKDYARRYSITGANFSTAYSDQTYSTSDLGGKLLSIGRSQNEGEYYMPVSFSIRNTSDLIPGVFAEIWLLCNEKDNVITLPLSAITEEQGLYFVYLKLDEQCYKKQEVTLGADDGQRTEVLSGLSAGDNVVIKGAYNVKLASASNAIPAHSHSH